MDTQIAASEADDAVDSPLEIVEISGVVQSSGWDKPVEGSAEIPSSAWPLAETTATRPSMKMKQATRKREALVKKPSGRMQVEAGLRPTVVRIAHGGRPRSPMVPAGGIVVVEVGGPRMVQVNLVDHEATALPFQRGDTPKRGV